MSAINERVSPKRLAEIIARAEVCDDSVLTDYRDIESIARELQQYRAAEPIYQAKFSLGWRDVTKAQYDDNASHGAPVRIVYAAPKVTSVPDESAIFDAAIDICRKSDAIDEHAWNRGVLAVMSAFQACRAAMLNGGKS